MANKRARRTKGRLSHDEVVRLYTEDKLSTIKISELDGTTRITILKLLHREGVEMRPRGNHPDQVRWTKHGLNAGWKDSGVAAATLARFRAILFLGGECTSCGCDDLRVLEVNHINEKHSRVLRQKELHEAIDGKSENLEVRCANCNILYEYEVGRRVLPNPSSLEGWKNEG